MAIQYAKETITTKAGRKTAIITAVGFDYKKHHKWFTNHGFRYFGINYAKLQGRSEAYFGIQADKLAEDFPEVYKRLMSYIEPKKADKPNFDKMTKKELIAFIEAMNA